MQYTIVSQYCKASFLWLLFVYLMSLSRRWSSISNFHMPAEQRSCSNSSYAQSWNHIPNRSMSIRDASEFKKGSHVNNLFLLLRAHTRRQSFTSNDASYLHVFSIGWRELYCAQLVAIKVIQYKNGWMNMQVLRSSRNRTTGKHMTFMTNMRSGFGQKLVGFWESRGNILEVVATRNAFRDYLGKWPGW